MQGVTPDQRVIAATKRQPEYGKPVGAYVNAIVSRGRIADGADARRANGPRPSTRSRRNSASSAGCCSRCGASRPTTAPRRIAGTCSARSRRSAYVQLPPSLFPQRTDRRDAHHAGRPLRARQDGQFLGRRHGPDPVHAVELSSTTPSTSPATASADIWSNVPDVLGSTANYLHKGTGSTACPGASRSIVPKGFDYMQQPRHFRRMGEARRAPRRRQAVSGDAATASCSFRAAPRARPSSSRENFDVLKEYNNSDAYAIAVGHLADRIARRRADQGRVAGRRPSACRATRASPCRRSSPRSATR